MIFAPETHPMEPESWDVDRRQDGAVLVRVHSTDRNGRRLPDAVFAFRLGDPQYNYWEEKYRNSIIGKG
ncbi:MAG: hypothetical protein ABSG67_06785 [Thermoguttaceae bacterium]|jgi:hypothetical protein